MEMLFLGSVINNYSGDKSCLQTCFPRLACMMMYHQYISPRDIAQNQFFLANVVPKLSQEVYLGKGSDGTLTTLRYSFYLFTAAG